MKRVALFILIILCFARLTACGGRYARYQAEFDGYFGTSFILVGYARSQSAFTRCAEIVRGRIAELHVLYDIYNKYENINNLYVINENAGVKPVEVSSDIIDLLSFMREGYEMTGGAVNMALGPVLKLWHEHRDGNTNAMLPAMEELREAAALSDINGVIIDVENNTVFLNKQGMSLDVGAAAKAYAAGLAMKAAEEAGFASILLNAGGNITAVGKPADDAREYWNIGIQNPDAALNGADNLLDTVYANDASLSCSGGYIRYYIVDGEIYNHIIDPNTLMPASRYKQVSVLHPSAETADLLSTALFILPYEEGKALAERYGADALWIDNEGGWLYTGGYAAVSKALNNQ